MDETSRTPAIEKRGMPRWYGYRAQFEAMAQGPDPLMALMAQCYVDYVNDVISAVEKGEPTLSTWYGNANEIPAAMGIPMHCPGEASLVIDPEQLANVKCGPMPDNTCALLKFGVNSVLNELVPTPTGIVAMIEPCDGQGIMHEYYQDAVPEWRDLPMFGLDAPYGTTDEDYQYFADQLVDYIAWLENLTGRKMDYDRLREICEETNLQYTLFAEICELQHARPAPLPSLFIAQFLPTLLQHIRIGDPGVTRFVAMLAAKTRADVAAGIGAIPNERIRCYWLDLPYAEAPEYGAWLAETYGAIIVNSTWGEGRHYTRIDTSTPESMLLGIARRSINEVPMIRQARGSVETIMDDIKYAVEAYGIDCVIYPGHRGHKDMPATVAFMRKACEEMGVPLMCLSTDLCDPTFMPVAEVERQTAEFFEAHGWEPLAHADAGAESATPAEGDPGAAGAGFDAPGEAGAPAGTSEPGAPTAH